MSSASNAGNVLSRLPIDSKNSVRILLGAIFHEYGVILLFVFMFHGSHYISMPQASNGGDCSFFGTVPHDFDAEGLRIGVGPLNNQDTSPNHSA